VCYCDCFSSCHRHPTEAMIRAFQTTSQDIRQAHQSKRKRSPKTTPDLATSSTSTFFSPNQFAVLSDSETEPDELNHHPQPSNQRPRIPPIVIYSFLTNHSSTLQKVNNKLSTPVEVKPSQTGFSYTRSQRKTRIQFWQKSSPQNWNITHTHSLTLSKPDWY